MTFPAKYVWCILFVLPSFIFAQTQPCSLENGLACVCPKEAASCDLLPDMVIDKAVFQRSGGIVEYSQTEAAPNTGLLRITVSTPNLGYGPVVALAKDKLTCNGAPYVGSLTGKCPDGSYPHRLVNQQIYRKEGGKIVPYERPAGYMVYHPTHQHMHTNDWEYMTLRVKTEGIADPRKWPIIGSTVKTGFCLQDYRSCSQLNGSCQDANGKILKDSDLPNFGLGGGKFNCDASEQGISVGYVDVYPYYYDGMAIRIPPETCNGAYQVVIEVDPLRQYAELDTTNNVLAVPVFLTSQRSGFHPYAKLSFSRPPRQLCEGDELSLSASPAFTYKWSNGATTPSIRVTQSGTYEVEMTAPCGKDKTKPVTLQFTPQTQTPSLFPTTKICRGQTATLTAATNNVLWYQNAKGGSPLGQGASFKTPPLKDKTTYYAAIPSYTTPEKFSTGLGSLSAFQGGFHANTDGYLIFNAYQPLFLKSVKVKAEQRGLRTIELRDGSGEILRDTTLLLPEGESRVPLYFKIPSGQGYQLGLSNHSVGGLYRTNDLALKYPIEIENVISITGASAGLAYYYYFYDWELEEQAVACTNKRVAVEVPVAACEADFVEVQLAPNPADQQVQLFVPFDMEGLQYTVVDMAGRSLMQGTIPLVSAQTPYAVSTAGLANGVYFIQLRQNEKTAVKQFVIAR